MVMGMGKAAVDGTVCVYHILGSSGSSTGVFWSSFATASAAPSSLHTHHARHTGTPAQPQPQPPPQHTPTTTGQTY